VSGPRVALAVLAKDVLLDWRSRDRVGHMAVFAALVIALVAIALPRDEPALRGWIPVLLWVVFLFTALLGLARSFASETDEGALAVLAQVPCDRGWVFAGKAGANFVALAAVEVWTALLAALFLEVDWTPALPDALVAGALGAAGLAVVGTLLAALSAQARFREFLLPVLLFPLALPVLVLASDATAEALRGRAPSPVRLGALGLYAWTFALIAYFTFEHVLED
jgi:heme exporter protein CcmB